MNEQELKKWFVDARIVLSTCGYSEEETKIILDWFHHIRGSDERVLIGDAAVDAHSLICDAIIERTGKFNLYNSLMWRLIMYAPLILDEWKNLPDWQKN